MTLTPLLNKRLALKSALLTLNKYDCRRPVYQALASAEKLVTGYMLRIFGLQECALRTHRSP